MSKFSIYRIHIPVRLTVGNHSAFLCCNLFIHAIGTEGRCNTSWICKFCTLYCDALNIDDFIVTVPKNIFIFATFKCSIRTFSYYDALRMLITFYYTRICIYTRIYIKNLLTKAFSFVSTMITTRLYYG